VCGADQTPYSRRKRKGHGDKVDEGSALRDLRKLGWERDREKFEGRILHRLQGKGSGVSKRRRQKQNRIGRYDTIKSDRTGPRGLTKPSENNKKPSKMWESVGALISLFSLLETGAIRKNGNRKEGEKRKEKEEGEASGIRNNIRGVQHFGSKGGVVGYKTIVDGRVMGRITGDETKVKGLSKDKVTGGWGDPGARRCGESQ